MFANKVVLVTGGSSGIGAATVEQFAKEGAAVAFCARNETKLNEVAKRCEKYGAKTLVIKADISKDEDAKAVIKKTIEKFEKLDELVNNAGILRFATVLEPNLLETYDEIMNTNLRPVIHLTSLSVPHLIKTKGNIINVSSVASTTIRLPGLTSYCVSKAGMDHFTRGAALDLAASGVRVNAVNPGPVITDIATNASMDNVEFDQKLADMTALGRNSDAVEVADLILYLASDKAKGITGSCYVIDNGLLIK